MSTQDRWIHTPTHTDNARTHRHAHTQDNARTQDTHAHTTHRQCTRTQTRMHAYTGARTHRRAHTCPSLCPDRVRSDPLPAATSCPDAAEPQQYVGLRILTFWDVTACRWVGF